MKKQFFKILSNILFLGIFIFLYFQNADSISIVKEISWPLFVIVLIIQFLGLVVNDLVIKTTVKSLGTTLSFLNGLYSAFISSFGNYFLPLSGGAALRGYYLKKHHKFSYKKFLTVMYGLYAVSFLFTSSILLTALTGMIIVGREVSIGLFIFTSIVFIFSFALFTGRIGIITWFMKLIDSAGIRLISVFFQKIRKVIDGWTDIISNRTLKIKLIIFTALNIFLRTFMYFIMFKSLGVQVNLIQVLIFNSLISLSLYVTLTPGSLGIRESILLFFSTTIGISNDQILAISLIDRITMITVLLLLFLYFRFVKKVDLFEVRNKGVQDG